MKLAILAAATAIVSLSSTAVVRAHSPDEADDDRLHAIEYMFQNADMVGETRLIECTLSGGTKTTCASVTFRRRPTRRAAGPWCPDNVEDGPAESGIWFGKGTIVDADGAFMANLAEFYDDPEWSVVDPETGEVKVTRTVEACEAAARPDVDPRYRNHCVQCPVDMLPDNATTTYVFPLTPVPAKSPRPVRGFDVGVALDGMKLDGPAPIDAILGAHTVAPFDDCGGHVNPHAGYHYHAVTSCIEGVASGAGDNDAPIIGIAMDGYTIRAHQNADTRAPLDQCGGHALEGDLYHYHAGEAGSNQIVGCLTGEYGCGLSDPMAVCYATRRPDRAGPPLFWRRVIDFVVLAIVGEP